MGMVQGVSEGDQWWRSACKILNAVGLRRSLMGAAECWPQRPSRPSSKVVVIKPYCRW